MKTLVGLAPVVAIYVVQRIWSVAPEAFHLVLLGSTLLIVSSLGKKIIRWQAARELNSERTERARAALVAPPVVPSERQTGF